MTTSLQQKKLLAQQQHTLIQKFLLMEPSHSKLSVTLFQDTEKLLLKMLLEQKTPVKADEIKRHASGNSNSNIRSSQKAE